MTTYGVTDTGFVLKRLSQILSDMVDTLSTVQDPISGEYLTPNLSDENDPLVQIINAHSAALSEAWEQVQLAYNQFDPLKATGAGLTGLVQLNGLRRLGGTKSTVILSLTGTAGVTVPLGKTVTDMNNTYSWVLPEWTFDGLGEASVTATASDYGPSAAAAGALVKIVTPYSGWTSVTNLLSATPGTYEETDTELRLRQQQSTSATAQSVVDSLYAAVMALDDVEFVRVYQNRTLITDSLGLPGKSVSVVVDGGDDSEIADAIFRHIPLGVSTYGNEYYEITDTQGISYYIYFMRVIPVPVSVDVQITLIDLSLNSSDVADLITEYVYNYASTGADSIGISVGFDRNGYTPGEAVYASELYTPVNKIKGIRIDSILVDFADSSTPTPSSSVEIEWDEVAQFSLDNITVTES